MKTVYIAHGEYIEIWPVEEMVVSGESIVDIIKEVINKYPDKYICIYGEKYKTHPKYGEDKKIIAQKNIPKNKWRVPVDGYEYLDCEHEKLITI